MTARPVAEWIGKTPQTKIPDRVKLRIVLAQNGKCAITGQKFRPGDTIEYDHEIALINGGENRESNIRAVLTTAHKTKTAKDVAQKAKNDRVRKKHFGINSGPRSVIPGSKRSKWKKTIGGTAVLRD